MPQFAPGTDVCRTRVLLATMAEYRVTSVLSDEGWLKGRQSVQQEVEVGGCNHSTIKRHIPIAWEEFINSSHLETSPTPVPTLRWLRSISGARDMLWGRGRHPQQILGEQQLC